MRAYSGFDAVPRSRHAVVTVGTFDGVHLGHRAIIDELVGRAGEAGGESVVVTFDVHPREVLTGEPVPLLTTVAERAEVLEQWGVDLLIVPAFSKEFAALPARTFVRDLLVHRLGMRAILIGHDHGFGRGREGNQEMLETLGRETGFQVVVLPARAIQEQVVSSTYIRRLLAAEGEVTEAARLLGRAYSLSGGVVSGDKIGRTIGFPTANLQPVDSRKLVPKNGVYAVRVQPEPGAAVYAGMMNIGARPTFAGTERRLEVHLLNFEGDLYESLLKVEFVARLRDEQRFESVEALVEQLSQDRARCIKMLSALS